MRELLKNRLQSLKVEFGAGREMLAELELRESNLRATMARIGGAIRVLEELLDTPASQPGNTVAPAETAPEPMA